MTKNSHQRTLTFELDQNMDEFDQKWLFLSCFRFSVIFAYVRRCQFFSQVHWFWSYSFGHLDLVKWITLKSCKILQSNYFQKKVDEILGEKTDDSTSVEINIRPNNFEQSRRTLKKAFSESPYDRYMSKVISRFGFLQSDTY